MLISHDGGRKTEDNEHILSIFRVPFAEVVVPRYGSIDPAAELERGDSQNSETKIPSSLITKTAKLRARAKKRDIELAHACRLYKIESKTF